MTSHPEHDPAQAPRRTLFARIAALTTLATSSLAGPAAATTAKPASPNDGPDWPGRLAARHKQVVDMAEVAGGAGLNFASTFLTTNAPGAALSVLILRHAAMPLALDSALWSKYRVGETLGITDPATKAAAARNPFLGPKPAFSGPDDAALDRLIARGVLVGVCKVALTMISTRLATNAGVTAEEAARDWAANLVPGSALLPSGVWGVNRAQEAGCTYCAG